MAHWRVHAAQLVVFASLLTPVTGRAADTKWRIDIEGGGFFPTSDVQLPTRELHAHGMLFTGNYTQAPPAAPFDKGGSYAVAVGYAVTRYVDAVAQYQQEFSQ